MNLITFDYIECLSASNWIDCWWHTIIAMVIWSYVFIVCRCYLIMSKNGDLNVFGFSEARDEKWSSTKPSQYRKGLQLCAVCMCVCDQRAAAISTSLFIIVFLFSFWFFLSIRSKNACMRANVGVCVVHSFDCLQFDRQTRTDNQSKPKTNRVRNYLRQQQTEKKKCL